MAKYKKRKDGRYATTVMIGYKPDGKPNNVFLSAKSEKELKEKIFELKMKIKTGEVVKTSDTLLRDYADNWLETYKASTGINTKAMYKNALNYIKPELGHLPLNKIVRSDVQKLINDNQEHPRTCEIIRLTLASMAKSISPCPFSTKVRLPRGSYMRGRSTMRGSLLFSIGEEF